MIVLNVCTVSYVSSGNTKPVISSTFKDYVMLIIQCSPNSKLYTFISMKRISKLPQKAKKLSFDVMSVRYCTKWVTVVYLMVQQQPDHLKDNNIVQ